MTGRFFLSTFVHPTVTWRNKNAIPVAVENQNQTLAFQGADASKISFLNKETPSEGAAAATTTTAAPGAQTSPADANKEVQTTTTNASAEGAAAQGTTTENQNQEGTDTNAETQVNQPEGEYTEEQFTQDVDTFISNSTNGAIKSVTEISAILKENQRLQAELKEGPKFPNEAARKVYETAVKAAGSEMATAKKLFHVLSLDLSTMTPKEKQFEAFVLDRPSLTREDARKRFEAVYEKRFGDLENDLVQQDDHDVATRDSETKLNTHLSDLEKSIKPSGNGQTQVGPTPEQIQHMETQLETALGQFGGVSLKFDDGQYGTLKVPMDQGKAKEFLEVLKNPHSIVDQIADTCRDSQGQLDLNDFVREMYLLFDSKRIQQEERSHLMKLGKVAQMQEAKNTQKKDIREEATTQPKPSFKEAFTGAVQTAGLV